MGKPGEGKGGEKEPLCHTILSLVPRLCCCQRQTTLQTGGGGGRGPAAPDTPGNRAAPIPSRTLVCISSAVSVRKLRHKVCLCFPKAAGIQVAGAAIGSVPCLDLTAPASPSSHLSIHVGSGGTGCGDGICPHGQLTSAQGQKTALGNKTSSLPCPSILPRQLPWLPWAHRGHQDFTSARGEFQWALLWDKVPKTPAIAPQWPPPSAHTHPWCWTWPTAPTARSAARVLCAEPCPARRSHALDFPLWVPVRLSSKEKGSLSDSHPP